jgi:hypothetical protein
MTEDPDNAASSSSTGDDGAGVPTSEQVAVYGWLAANDWQLETVQAVTDLGLSEAAITESIGYCVRLGLLKVDVQSPTSFLPVDPDLVAASVAAPVEKEMHDSRIRLQRLQESFGLLRAEYRESRRRTAGLIEVIPTMAHVRAALNRASDECREEILASQPGGNRDEMVLEDASIRDMRSLRRGVRMRTLYHHTARFNGPSQAYVAATTALGAEYRTAHTLFGRLIIFDRELAFLPEPANSWGAVLIREPSAVHYLCEIFEQTWELAQPFSEAVVDGLEDVAREIDQTILRLLAAGLKDETIARRLGMSLRTVRKHIAAIMKSLGADSRFQAGVNAACANLIRDDLA